MEWIKKHVDTAIVISVLFGGFFWIDGKFDKINERLISLEKDVSNVKTILFLKGIMPQEFVADSK